AARSRWRQRLTRRSWSWPPNCPQREQTLRRRRRRTVTITPSTAKLTSTTDAPGRRSIRLVESSRGAVPPSPLARPAPRTGRAPSNASGHPRAPWSFDGLHRRPLGPRIRDLRSAVAVPGDRHRRGVEEPDAVVVGHQPGRTGQVAPSNRLPFATAVLAAQPSKHPKPRIAVQVVEGLLGAAVPEVDRPAPQRRVDLAQEDG